MSDLPETRQMTHRIDHVVRSFPLRFMDDERAVVRRRLWLSWHSWSDQYSVVSFQLWFFVRWTSFFVFSFDNRTWLNFSRLRFYTSLHPGFRAGGSQPLRLPFLLNWELKTDN